MDPCQCRLNNGTGLYDCYDSDSSVNYCTSAATTLAVNSTTTSENPTTTITPITSSNASTCAGSLQACGVASLGFTDSPDCCSGYTCDLTILSCLPQTTSTTDPPLITTPPVTSSTETCAGSLQACGVASLAFTDNPDCCTGYTCDLTAFSCFATAAATTTAAASSQTTCAGSLQDCGVASLGFTDSPDCCSGYTCDLTVLSCFPEATAAATTTTAAEPEITPTTTEAPVMQTTCADSSQRCDASFTTMANTTYTLTGCCGDLACNSGVCGSISNISTTSSPAINNATTTMESSSEPVASNSTTSIEITSEAAFPNITTTAEITSETVVANASAPIETTSTPSIANITSITSVPAITNTTGITETTSDPLTTSSTSIINNTTLDAVLAVTCAGSSMACSTGTGLIGTSMYNMTGCCDGLTCNSGLCMGTVTSTAASTLAPYINSTTTTSAPVFETTCAGALELCSTSSAVIGTDTYSVTGCCSGYTCNTVCEPIETPTASATITATSSSNETIAISSTESPANLTTTESPVNVTTTESSANVTVTTAGKRYSTITVITTYGIPTTITSVIVMNTTWTVTSATPTLLTTCAVDSQSCNVASTYFSNNSYALTGCCDGYECDETMLACVPMTFSASNIMSMTSNGTITSVSNNTLATTTMAPEANLITTCAVDSQACSVSSTYFSNNSYALTGCCDNYQCDETMMACVPMAAATTAIIADGPAVTPTLNDTAATTEVPISMNTTTTVSASSTTTANPLATCTAEGDPCNYCDIDMCICRPVGWEKRDDSDDSTSYYCEKDYCHCQQDPNQQWHCGTFNLCKDPCSGPYSDGSECYDGCDSDYCMCKSNTCIDPNAVAATSSSTTAMASSTSDISTTTDIPIPTANSTVSDNSTDTTYQNATDNSTTNFNGTNTQYLNATDNSTTADYDQSGISNYTDTTNATYPNATSDPMANYNGSSAANSTQIDATYSNTTSDPTASNYNMSTTANSTGADVMYPNTTSDTTTPIYNDTSATNYTAIDATYSNTTTESAVSNNQSVAENIAENGVKYPNVTTDQAATQSNATDYTDSESTYPNVTSGSTTNYNESSTANYTDSSALYPNVTDSPTSSYNGSTAANFTGPPYPNVTDTSNTTVNMCSEFDSEGMWCQDDANGCTESSNCSCVSGTCTSCALPGTEGDYCYDNGCGDGQYEFCTCKSGVCTEPPPCSGYGSKCYSCEGGVCHCGDPSLYANQTTSNSTCRMERDNCPCMIDPVEGWWNCGDYNTCTDPCAAPNTEGYACDGLCGAENCFCSAGTCNFNDTAVNNCSGTDYYGMPYTDCNTCGADSCTCAIQCDDTGCGFWNPRVCVVDNSTASGSTVASPTPKYSNDSTPAAATYGADGTPTGASPTTSYSNDTIPAAATTDDPYSAPTATSCPEGQPCDGLCNAEHCICSGGTCEIDNTQANNCSESYYACNTCGYDYCACDSDQICIPDPEHCAQDDVKNYPTQEYVCGSSDLYSDPCSSPISEGDACYSCSAGSCSCQSGICQNSTLLNATCNADGSCDSCEAEQCRCQNFSGQNACKPDTCYCNWNDATSTWQCGDVNLCESRCEAIEKANMTAGSYAACYSCKELSCVCSDGDCVSWPTLEGEDPCVYYSRNPGDSCYTDSCGAGPCECGTNSTTGSIQCLAVVTSNYTSTTGLNSSSAATTSDDSASASATVTDNSSAAASATVTDNADSTPAAATDGSSASAAATTSYDYSNSSSTNSDQDAASTASADPSDDGSAAATTYTADSTPTDESSPTTSYMNTTFTAVVNPDEGTPTAAGTYSADGTPTDGSAATTSEMAAAASTIAVSTSEGGSTGYSNTTTVSPDTESSSSSPTNDTSSENSSASATPTSTSDVSGMSPACNASVSLKCSGCDAANNSDDCYCNDEGVCEQKPCENCVISSDGKTMMCPADDSCQPYPTVQKRDLDIPFYNHTDASFIGPARLRQRDEIRTISQNDMVTRRSPRSEARSSEHTLTYNTSQSELWRKRQQLDHIKAHAVIEHGSHALRVRNIWGTMEKRDYIEVLPPGYEDPIPDAWDFLLWTTPLTIRRTSGSIVTTTVAATFTLDVFSDGSTSWPSLTSTPPMSTASTIPACIPATFIRPYGLAKRDQSVLGVVPYVSRSSTTVTVGIRDNYLLMTSNLPTITQGLPTATAAALKDSNPVNTPAAQNNGNNVAGTAAAQNNGNAAGTAAKGNGNAATPAAQNNGNAVGTAAAQNNGNNAGTAAANNNGNNAVTPANNGNAANNGNNAGTSTLR